MTSALQRRQPTRPMPATGDREVFTAEEELERRIVGLESALRQTIRLLVETISYVPVTPGRYARLQHEAETLARFFIVDG